MLLNKLFASNLFWRIAEDRDDEREISAWNRRQIILWWESRRFAYNALVGIAGVGTWISVVVFGSLAVKPGVDFEEPFALIFGPFFWAFWANACYSFGWVVDIALYKRAPSRKLFTAGLVFSVIITALPGLWALTAWILTLITGQKMD